VTSEEENSSEQVEEAAPDEAPAEEAAAEDAPAEEAPAEQAEEPAAEEEAAPEPAEEPPAEEAPAPQAEPAAPVESLGPKEIRRRARSQHTGEAGPPRSSEERIADRAARREAAAAARRRNRARARAKHEPRTGTPPAERTPGSKKVRQGTVVSSKADKTITVRIELVRRHPQYEKIVRKTATIHAHDEANDANEGDVVRVIESRPLSRTKRWRLVEVMERAR
jgi:small subunit ribosomal protein S17